MDLELVGVIVASTLAGMVAGWLIVKLGTYLADKKLHKQILDKIQSQDKQDFIIDGKKYKLAEIVDNPPPLAGIPELPRAPGFLRTPVKTQDQEPDESHLPDLPIPSAKKELEPEKKKRLKASDLMGVRRR